MLTGLLGNGLAIVIGGVSAVLALSRKYFPRWFPSWADEAALTLGIVGMLFAGVLSRSTGLGHMAMSAVNWLENLAGSDLHKVLGVLTLALVGFLVWKIFTKGATVGAMAVAFAAPFALAMFSYGVFHNLDVALQQPAQQAAQSVALWLGVA